MKRNNFPVKALIRIFLSQFYIWSLLLLDGCASLPVIEDEVKSGQKAVILTIGYTLSPLYRSNFMLMSAEWTNQEAKANFSTAETCFSRACKTIQVFSVKPGIYSLSKLTFDSHAEGYSADIPSDFASFEVKGGEVVYIGDVFFDARDTKIIVAGLEILDSFKEAQSVFAQQYPRLSNRLVKRLAHLHPSITFSNSIQSGKGANKEIESLEWN